VGVGTLVKSCGGGLVELSLCNTPISDEALFSIAMHCPFLERLDLSHCSAFTDEGIGVIIRHCHSLKTLHLSFCTKITGSGIALYSERELPLRELILLGCRGITAESLARIAKCCPHLVTLDLSAVPAAEIILPSIAKSGAAWRALGLAWLPGVHDASLAAVARYCSELRILDLQGDTQVTDTGLRSIAERVSGLAHVNMRDGSISDIGLCALAAHCKDLISFDGTRCHRVTDMGLQGLLMSCTHLETLFLGETEISDVGLLLVAEHGKRLKQFGLAGCPHLTRAGISRLCASRKDIHYT